MLPQALDPRSHFKPSSCAPPHRCRFRRTRARGKRIAIAAIASCVGAPGQKRAREKGVYRLSLPVIFFPTLSPTLSFTTSLADLQLHSTHSKTSLSVKPRTHTTMFASRVILQARAAPSLTRTVTTIARDSAPKVSSSSNAAAISTTATAKAAVNSDKHTRDFGGRLISKNR